MGDRVGGDDDDNDVHGDGEKCMSIAYGRGRWQRRGVGNNAFSAYEIVISTE